MGAPTTMHGSRNRCPHLKYVAYSTLKGTGRLACKLFSNHHRALRKAPAHIGGGWETQTASGNCEEAYQGFAGAIGILRKIFHDRVIQEVQPIYKDRAGPHALHHKQHYPIPA